MSPIKSAALVTKCLLIAGVAAAVALPSVKAGYSAQSEPKDIQSRPWTVASAEFGLQAETANTLQASSLMPPNLEDQLPQLTVWDETPELDINEAPREYTEALTLTIQSSDHPEINGLTVGPCNPKPFIDKPHVPTEWTGPAPSWTELGLNTLPLFLSTYKTTLFLCVNQTGTATSLRYSADNKSDLLPSNKGPLNAGSIWDSVSISALNDKVGVAEDGEIYYWDASEPTQPLESRSSDWYICEARARDQSVKIQVLTTQAGASGPKALGIFGTEINVVNCKLVKMQRTAHKILDPKLESPEAAITARYGSTAAQNEDSAIEALYGGPESPYYEWIRNLTIVSKKPGSHVSLASPFGMLFSMY